MTFAPDQEGWVGHWSPGIGDPNAAGFITVALYVAAAMTCLWVARRIRREEGAAPLNRREFWVWCGSSILLWFLGANKQLDLQTAFTEIGRILARREGWYAQRAHFQNGFIALLSGGGVLSASTLLVLLRRVSRHAKVAALGMCAIGVFVLIRASSFHKVDAFLGERLINMRMNWILEMGGISIVLLAGLGRLRILKARGMQKAAGDAQPAR